MPVSHASAHVEQDFSPAVVTLLGKGGHGVLVHSGLILTAAHCISFSTEGAMVLGDFFIEKIEAAGEVLSATPVAVEPIKDIAVLGSLDDQSFPDEADAFERFCERTRSVPVSRHSFTDTHVEFSVQIYTHLGTWARGRAQCFNNGPMLSVEAEEQIEGGASGGPIFDDSGELVGIVSHFSMGSKKCTGMAPRPHLTLPTWACEQIFGR